MSLLRKIHPGFTTRQAKDNKPIRNNSSLLVHFLREVHNATNPFNSRSFSGGRRTIRLAASIRIPNNVIHWDGPSSFSSEIGTPKMAKSPRLYHVWPNNPQTTCQPERSHLNNERSRNTKLVDKNPSQSVGKAVEDERGRSHAKR